MRAFQRFVSAAAILAAVALSAQPALAQSDGARDREVALHNHAQVSVWRFYASRVGVDSWQEDMLGGTVLFAGRQKIANIDDGSGACRYDIKVEFNGGKVLTKMGVNVCAATVIDIYADRIVVQYPST